MNENLKLWESVSRVPPEHLKGFKRSGGFSGTAIKPMWSIKTMTEYYGPCGIGWGVLEPKFDVHQGHNEVLVFCTVGVWHKSPECVVYGVGGDKILAQFSSGPRNDDEAFKKAYTDAITNALKMIGVGADIHMGLWDGNKYVDQKQDEAADNDAPDPMGKAFNASKNDTRPIKDALCRAIWDCPTKKALEMLGASSDFLASLQKLNDDLKQVVRETYQDRMKELLKGLAA